MRVPYACFTLRALWLLRAFYAFCAVASVLCCCVCLVVACVLCCCVRFVLLRAFL